MVKTNKAFRWGRIIWLLLTDKKFKFHFEELIHYGLFNYAEKRGNFASGACMCDTLYRQEIFKY